MTAPVLGIDLGTTNSVVAIADAGAVRVLAGEDGGQLVPSVVAFPPDGPMLVGRSARERRLIDARNTVYSVKRLIGRPYRSAEVQRARERFAFELAEGPTGGIAVKVRSGSFQVPEISAFVLGEVRRIAEAAVGEPCTRAVVTVPANFNELQRSATKAAGSIAGLDVLRILNEPTAAALAYGLQLSTTEKIAVYDLGGGTFDFTILEADSETLQVVSTAGDTFLGGDDFDVLLADQLAEAFLRRHRWNPRDDLQAYERLRAAAEWAKCELSRERKVQVRVAELTYGAGGRALDLEHEVRRGDFEAAIGPLVGRSFDVVQEGLRLASLKAADIDTVVLVGGSTRVPLVKLRVREYFGKEPKAGIDPDLVVAQGAAIQGRSLLGQQEQRAIGRVRLKRVTQADVEAAKKKSRRSSQRGPEQPAFAPDRPSRAGVKLTAAVEVGATGSGEPTRRRRRSSRRGAQTPAPPPSTTLPYGPSPAGAPLELGATTPDGAPAGAAPLVEEPTVVVDASYAALTATLTEQPIERFLSTSDEPELRIDELPWPGADEWSGTGSLTDLDEPTSPGVPSAPRAPAPPPPPAPPPAAPPREAAAVVARPPPSAPARRPPPPQPPPQPPPAPSVAARPAQRVRAPEPQPLAEDPFAGVDDLPLPQRPAPLLMDVTPQSLGLETAGGYCRQLIRRGSPIPVDASRTFTTARDLQEVVAVRVCQGEAERFADNQLLGEVVLEGLPLAPRGAVQIEVSFGLGADGTLEVRARDVHSQREQRVLIRLLGGLSQQEIAAARDRQATLRRS